MRPQINALTATRAFAAILVFYFHFGRDVYLFHVFLPFFNNTNIAVSYFFVLSGFVLYISYINNNISYIDFLKKRIGRIVPVYLLALGLSVIVYLFIYHDVYNSEVTKQIVYSALFIQAYFPGYALTLNTAAWSISVEMLFYLLFPFFLLLQRKNARIFIALAILAYVGTQVSFLLFFRQDPTQIGQWNFFMYNPVMHMNQFMIGMAGGYLFKKINTTEKKTPLMPLILFCIIVLVLVAKPDHLHCEAGLIAPLFMLFIISVAINNPRFLNFRPLVFLGKISYGIYILQFPVMAFLNGCDVLHKLFFEEAFFYFSLCVLILTATISYYLLERPLRRKIAAISFSHKKSRINPGNY